MTVDRTALARVIAVANGKGGVGKTSLTAHVGGLAAEGVHEDGGRVLLVDLDPQGNLGEDLGYTGAGLGDDGQGLVSAVLTGQQPAILTNVRPGLDVIPGGPALHDLAGALEARRRRTPEEAVTALARVLSPIAGRYMLTKIDCPPGHDQLQELALVAARYLLIPTKTDQSSRKGLREIARRFVHAREINPELALLGVVLFGVTKSASRVHKRARDVIEAELGGAAPVFAATIRHVEAAAVDGRDRGQLAHELERAVLAARGERVKALRDGKRPSGAAKLAASALSLAEDYQALTEEVLAQLAKTEAEE